MNVSLKGTECLQKSFDGIFILSDKAAFMRETVLCVQPLPGKLMFLPPQKRLLLAENKLTFSKCPSPATFVFVVAHSFFSVFCSRYNFIFFILAEALSYSNQNKQRMNKERGTFYVRTPAPASAASHA